MTKDLRAKIAQSTLELFTIGKYRVGSRTVMCPHKYRNTSYTIDESLHVGKSRKFPRALLTVKECSAVGVLPHKTEGRVACVNFASTKNVGGAFLSGVLAPEEQLIVCSNLYFALRESPEFYNPVEQRQRVGIIYTEDVSFIRDTDYALQDKVILSDVISVPLPAFHTIPSGVDIQSHQFLVIFRDLFKQTLLLAQKYKVDHLVIGGFGTASIANCIVPLGTVLREELLGNDQLSKFQTVTVTCIENEPRTITQTLSRELKL